jgi:peroxiredoxin Q/BCP
MAKTKKVKLGDLVPELTLQNSQGEEVSLSSHKGQKIVLYFYPKDNTPGCTIEGQQFNELLKKFKAAKTVIFGISRDSVKSHDKFKCKYDFKFELLSDESEVACQMFDVIKEKNMYGKKVFGIERSTFILNEKNELIAEFRGVKADGHAAEVLEKIKDLKG